MSKPVSLTPPLPYPSFGRDLQELSTFDRDLVKSLVSYLSEVGLRLNGSLPKNGTEAMEGDLNMNGFDIVDVGNFVIDGPAGTARIITFTTGDSTRWVIAVDNTPETGSNAGSDFAIYRYSDTGVFLGQAFYIQRSTGDIYAENDVNVAGDANITGDVGAATATITADATVGGDLTVTDDITANQLYLTSTSDVTLATDGALTIGPTSGTNMAIDNNEIQGRNNGAANQLILNDNGGDVVVGGTATTGKLDLRVGKIQFPATQVASADANTLDDYEEGTFTPTLTFGGAAVGMTYSANRTGQYTKIGRVVYFQFDLELTAKGSSTGTAAIALTGLPAPSPVFFGACTVGFYIGAWALPAGSTLYAYTDDNTASITLRSQTNTGSPGTINDTHFTNNSRLSVSGFYMV